MKSLQQLSLLVITGQEPRSELSNLTKEITEFCETKKERSQRVDAMLTHLMRAKVKEWLSTGEVPGPMSLKEIADYCGVDEMVIHRAQQSAIRKISLKLKK